ncbi:class I SAM-dependent methyltransferase [bacterium]|nr:class I SAM-dependent methyltransferase [bacterium]
MQDFNNKANDSEGETEAGMDAEAKFIDPKEIIGQLELEEGSAVADFGCGSGYFSIPFAKEIGSEGKIYCLDILSQALESVESQAKILGISNIFTKRVNLENENGSKLENNSLDWVIMKDVLFQNEKKENVIREAYRVLKPKGKILIMEWSDKNLLVGPEKGKRISPEKMKELVSGQKFTIKKNITAGDFHYVIVAEK